MEQHQRWLMLGNWVNFAEVKSSGPNTPVDCGKNTIAQTVVHRCDGIIAASMELDPCYSLEGSALGRGGLPESSPPYGSRVVARVDVDEGWCYLQRLPRGYGLLRFARNDGFALLAMTVLAKRPRLSDRDQP